MTRVKARGVLRHHFWGDYCATIGLAFDDEPSARAALAALKSPGWVRGEKPTVLVLHGPASVIDPAVTELEALRTDGPDDCPVCAGRSPRRRDCTKRTGREAIGGCRHSIDRGPLFAIAIDVTPEEQLRIGGIE